MCVSEKERERVNFLLEWEGEGHGGMEGGEMDQE